MILKSSLKASRKNLTSAIRIARVIKLGKTHFLDIKIRQGTLQTIKLICTLMKQVQPNNLSDAIDMFQSETYEDSFKLIEGKLLREIHRLITMYCHSSLTNFSLEPLNVRIFRWTHLFQDLSQPRETKDLRYMHDNLLISIESLHNIPDPWITNYHSFYIQVHVMHGLKSFGMFSESPRKIVKRHQFMVCPLQSWVR